MRRETLGQQRQAMKSSYPPVYPERFSVRNSGLKTAVRGASSHQVQIHIELPALCFMTADGQQFLGQILRNIHKVIRNKLFWSADTFEAQHRTVSCRFFRGFEHRSVISMCLVGAVSNDDFYFQFLDLLFNDRSELADVLPELGVRKLENPKICESEVVCTGLRLSLSSPDGRVAAYLSLCENETVNLCAFMAQFQRCACCSQFNIVGVR